MATKKRKVRFGKARVAGRDKVTTARVKTETLTPTQAVKALRDMSRGTHRSYYAAVDAETGKVLGVASNGRLRTGEYTKAVGKLVGRAYGLTANRSKRKSRRSSARRTSRRGAARRTSRRRTSRRSSLRQNPKIVGRVMKRNTSHRPAGRPRTSRVPAVRARTSRRPSVRRTSRRRTSRRRSR